MINWRKGLFRFCIVISTLWIISSVVLNIDAYNQASKKESRLKQIVAEIKSPMEALKKIEEEFPEFKQQYGFIDKGPVQKNKKPPGMFDDILNGSSNPFLKEPNPFLEKQVDIDKFDPTNILFIEICQKAENDRKDKLSLILLFSIIPPLFLLTIGTVFYWAFRKINIMKKHHKAAIIGGIFLTIISILPVIVAIGKGYDILHYKMHFVLLLPIIGIGISIVVITYSLSKE